MNLGLPDKTFDFSVGHSTPKAKWARRAKTIPGLIIIFILTWSLLPALIVVTFVHGLTVDRTFSTMRLTILGAWWLAMEFLGLCTVFLFWLIFAPIKKLGSARSRRWHSHLQRIWSRSLAFGAKYTIGLHWVTEGIDCVHGKGPLIVLARHGSQGDALLTGALLAMEGRRLRFVLKRQLLSDPCIDVFGHRVPNYFVDRDSPDNREELENIGLLASDLGDDEALIIFPEGTRFSPQKLAKAVAALSQTTPSRTAFAIQLRSVLPVRTAGTLAALATSKADIVICNHVGIQDISSLRQLRDAVPLKNTLRFKLWRTARSEISSENCEDEVVLWLDNQWAAVDDWVTSNAKTTSPKTKH